MNVWQLQEAKARLSEVVRLSREQPQVISVRGKEEIVMMSVDAYKKLIKKNEGLVQFFMKSPLKGLKLDLARDKSRGRNFKI